MSANDPLQLLRDNRAALLACEAIGWLHMAGKAHPDFVRQQALGATSGVQTWVELAWATNVIAKFGTLPLLGTQTITPSELFEKHRERSGGPERVNAFETGEIRILCRDRGGRGLRGVRDGNEGLSGHATGRVGVRCRVRGSRGELDHLSDEGVDHHDRGRERDARAAVWEAEGIRRVRLV